MAEHTSGSPDYAVAAIESHSLDELRQLGEAIADLAGDTSYITLALIDFIRSLRPVSQDGRLTRRQEEFLVVSGEFTADELAKTKRSVDKGSLQLDAAEAFLSNLRATMSLEDAAGYLGWDETAVRTAVLEGRLYGVEISGRLRLPTWQFTMGHPEKLLPGLTDIIAAVASRLSPFSVAELMGTPQPSLVAEGRKTPAAWLRDGGNVNAVTDIILATDWR